MSIETTITSLKRAKAVCDEANRVPVAKRGMFAMVEREHRYTLWAGAYAGYVSFTPCIVTSVDRAGIVKEVKLAGQSWPLKRRDWQQITVDSGGKVADPASVVAKLVDDHGHAIEYRDHGEAIRAIIAAAGLSH
jgi:hypothetical protein